MSGPIAKLFIALGMDAAQVEAGAAQAEKAVAGTGASMSSGMKRAGIVVGAAFGLATKGALKLEDAQARFQADTGASAAEADHFGDKLNDLSGHSLVAFDQLAGSMSMIRTDLGLTGADADKAADQFASYERATNQGADAVSAFDDIEDAFGKTAADTAGIMDVLVASHQKFGGSISDQQANLAKLSGVVQAYGGTWQDANKILNLANATGIDGTEMVKGLSTAVKKFPPGTTFDEMFASLVAIEDPAERAKVAIADFGAKAGPKLAAAIANGTTSLDQFMVTTQEAAGATKDAQQALDDTWGSKFKLRLKGAQAALTGFGKEAGPILTGAASAATLGKSLGLDKVFAGSWARLKSSSLVKGAVAAAGAVAGAVYSAAAAAAGKLADLLGGMWGKIKGSPKILAGAAAAGAESGAAFAGASAGAGFLGSLKSLATGAIGALFSVGGAISVGLGAAIGLAIGTAIEGPVVQKSIDEMNAKVSGALKGLVTDADFDHARSVLEQGLSDVSGSMFGLGGVLDFGAKDALQKQIDALDAQQAALHAAGERVPEAVADGVKDGAAAANRTLGHIDIGGIRESLTAANKGIRVSAKQLRDGITTQLGTVASAAQAAWDTVGTALQKGPKLLSRGDRLKQFARAQRNALRQLHRAVKADDPVNTAYWEQQYIAVAGAQRDFKRSSNKTWDEIEADAKAANVAIPEHVAKGGRRAEAAAKRHHRAMVRNARAERRDLTAQAQKSADDYAAAIKSGDGPAATAAQAIYTSVQGKLSALPAYAWGAHATNHFAGGITDPGALGAVSSAAAAVGGTVRRQIAFSAPPKEGPLSDIRSWGPHMLDHWSDATERHLGRVAKTAGRWADTAAPRFGDAGTTHRPAAGGRHGGHMARNGGDGGDVVHLHIGTLIANDKGLDELERRMARRKRIQRRDRRVIASPNGQDR